MRRIMAPRVGTSLGHRLSVPGAVDRFGRPRAPTFQYYVADVSRAKGGPSSLRLDRQGTRGRRASHADRRPTPLTLPIQRALGRVRIRAADRMS